MMVAPADSQPQILDPNFQSAVDLIDQGDIAGLTDLIRQHPTLLSETAEEDGTFAGDYFKSPYLLWFVAENPIRKGTLPANIVDVAQNLLNLLAEFEVPNRLQQMDYTLALITSGLVAREAGVQEKLAQTLVNCGADPNSGILSGLAHGESAACEVLLNCGATLTLPLAAGLGRLPQTIELSGDVSAIDLQLALAMSSINGQSETTRQLLKAGANPNEFNPQGAHAHSTALHQAVNSGSLDTVRILLEHGADPNIQDKIFGGNARGWAEHCGQPEIQRFLEHEKS